MFDLEVYFRGGYFPWGFISYLKLSGFFSVGVYFLDPSQPWCHSKNIAHSDIEPRGDLRLEEIPNYDLS